MEQEILKFLLNNCRLDTAVILIVLWFIYRQQHATNKVIVLMADAVRAGLLSHLTNIHSGAMKKGDIGRDTLRIAEECYKHYKSLQGDGYADNIMRELRELPTK